MKIKMSPWFKKWLIIISLWYLAFYVWGSIFGMDSLVVVLLALFLFVLFALTKGTIVGFLKLLKYRLVIYFHL